MKRTLLAFISASIFTIVANAYVLQLVPRLLPGGRVPLYGVPTTRTVDVSSDSSAIKISYMIPDIEVYEDQDLYPGRSFWKLENFGTVTKLGTPSYPIRNDLFILPADASDIKVSISKMEWKSFDNFTPTPARPPLVDGSLEAYSIDDVPDISPDSYIPSETPIYINDISVCDDKCYVYVTYEPCVFDFKTGQTKVCYLTDYTLTFVSNNEANDVSEKTERPENYLIITLDKYKNALSGFIKWKRQCGNNVKIVLADSWSGEGDETLRRLNLQNKIRETIKKSKSEDISLKYVILAGSAEELPGEKAKKHNYNNSVADTDYYYACVEGDDQVRNVITGRFLVNSIDEMSNIVKKTVLYEKGMAMDDEIYEKGVHLAYFQDSNNDGKEDRYFIHTSEYLRDKLLSYNYDIGRIYKSSSTVKPSEMNDLEGRVQHTFLPAELLDDGFNWNPKYTDVIDAINSGVQYALYRGHGAVSFWDEPYLAVSHMKYLSNSNRLPIVFSISCNTGAFSSNGFAKNLTSLSNAGAVSVIASEDVSYSYYNDYLIRGIFNNFWNMDSISPNYNSINYPIIINGIEKPVLLEKNTLGNALHYGGLYLGMFASRDYTQVTKELYHVFGDPGLVFNINRPWKRDDISFKISNNESSGTTWQNAILTTPIKSVIGYYNETTGKIMRLYGHHLTVPHDLRQDYTIVVQCYNYKPFIINVKHGIVTTSSPLASLDGNTGDIDILSSSEGTINVSYRLADDSIEMSNPFIEVRDFNYNVICKENCLDYEGEVLLNSSKLSKGTYVVRLLEEGHDPISRKVIITK